MDILPVAQGRVVAGPAQTLKYTPRNGSAKPVETIYSAIRRTDEGRILVIDSGLADTWLLGENIAHAAQFSGLAGIVSDSRLRDSAEIREMEIPVFARGISVRPPAVILSAVGVPIECGGAQVRPDDWIVGDDDGVVVVPAERLDDVLVEVADLEQLESDQEAALASKAPLEILEELLKRKKVRKGL